MLIKNICIKTMEDINIDCGFIYIKDGLINQIGEMKNLDFSDKESLDLRGLTAYPGFIDAHTHLGICEDALTFEGDDCNELCDPITPQLRAIDAINPMDRCFKEARLAGVTTVVIGPGSANPIAGSLCAIKTAGICVDDMIVADNVGIKFALGENPKNIYHEKDKSPYTRMAIVSLIREQLYKAKSYMQEKNEALANKDDLDPPEFDLKCEALIPLLEKKITAQFHAHRSDDIFTAIRIAKEFSLKYVIIHATEGHLITDNLKKENACVLSGPFFANRSKPELANLTPQSPGIMSNAKIQTAIITDHPETPIQYLSLCAALAVREGMDKDEALKAITINPAKICGIDDKVGSIAEGKDADLVLFKDDPLNLNSKPEMVFIKGVLQN